MTQTDLNVANGSGATVRADINDHLEALATQSADSTAPTTTFPNQWWYDTSTNILKQRNNANTAWLSLWKRASAGWQLLLTKGADIASGAALTLGTDGNYFDITGTTPVTSIATTGQVGTVVRLHFDDAVPFTHHATDLVLPGAANITTAAGDEAEFVEYASGDWRCVSYLRAAGRPLNSGVTDKLSVGFEGTSYSTGNTGAGTVTLVAANGNIQHGTVTGSFTLGAPTFTGVGYIEWEATNDGTGGYSPDVATNFANISGTYDATASVKNVFRISKLNTGTYLEIAQEA